jgi:molecular chaperone GrpE
MAERIGDGESAESESPVDTAELQAENNSLRDRMLRALADAENTRRRAERAQRDTRQFAITDFARELLPVVDNLQRTIAAAQRRAPESAEDAALIEGVRAIERLLLHTLGQFGIQPMQALGAPFDPSRHEAVAEQDDGSQPPGSVVSVLEDGYTLHDRLLRPARVTVARRRAQAPAPAEGDANGAEPGSRSSDNGP